MADSEVDEPTQLLLLASLLEPATYSEDELRLALSSARGDLVRAAEELLLPRAKSAGKRKAGTSLEGWFSKKRDAAEVSTPRLHVAQTSPPRPLALQVKQDSPGGSSKRDAFALLRSAPGPSVPIKVKAAPQPALLLTSQAAIDKHRLPLTLLTSPLSPAFASALYLAMMEESEAWGRHRWYLAGKWVESPHTMAGYYLVGGGHGEDGRAVRSTDGDGRAEGGGAEKARYFYSGKELGDPKPYPDLLRQAAALVEDAVNDALSKRARYPLEWAGRWRANVCGANRYDGASSGVGWHADQLSYLGPYATIASLSLGTPRAFRLRETDTVDPAFKQSASIRTYEINLGHNSLITMDSGCQERYKHTVPPQKALDLFRPGWDQNQQPVPPPDQKAHTTRINITFRFYREDFHPAPGTGPTRPRQGTPHCKCGIPTLLRADQKGKARSRTAAIPPSSPIARAATRPPAQEDEAESTLRMKDDDMAYFWQCQSSGDTGELKGCGFFRVLDMRAEGRGPCVVDVVGR